jgi:hypothetical protein
MHTFIGKEKKFCETETIVLKITWII